MTPNQAALLREAYRRSERRLENQQTFAVAFDGRSLLQATIIAAILAFLVARDTDHVFGLFTGAIVFLAISLVLALLSVYPTRFYTAGSAHGELAALIDQDADELAVIKGLAENNDRYIERNDLAASVRVTLYRLSTIFAVLGLPLATIALIRI